MTTYEIELPDWMDGVLAEVVPEGVDREAWLAYQVQQNATEGALQGERQRLQQQAQRAAQGGEPPEPDDTDE